MKPTACDYSIERTLSGKFLKIVGRLFSQLQFSSEQVD